MKYLIIIVLLLNSCTSQRSDDNLMPLTGDPQIDFGLMQLNMERNK